LASDRKASAFTEDVAAFADYLAFFTVAETVNFRDTIGDILNLQNARTVTLTNKTINLLSNTLLTTFAQLNTAVSDATLVDLDDAQTLTNKTIDGDDNTIVDINETQQNVSVGASGTVLTSNGVGVAPTYQAAGAASLPVVDTTSIAEGSADATKEVRFEVDGNTTGIIGVLATIFTTAKTITFPDATDTLVGKATTDILTNKTIDGDDNTILDINETQQNVSVGASGTILTSNGVGVAPTYQAGGAGTWTDTSTNTGTNKTLDDFSNTIEADAVHAQVRNESGVTMVQGDAVRITGFKVADDLPIVGFADASSSATMPAFCVINETIANNTNGDSIVSGRVSGFDTNSFQVGDALFVSNVGTSTNTLTATKPTGNDIVQKIAVVEKKNASNGIIYVIGAGRENDIPNTFSDAVFEISDDADATKELNVQLSGSTTATKTTLAFSQTANRTITFPDIVGTILLNLVEDTTPQLGGTLDLAGQNISLTGNSNIETGADILDIRHSGGDGFRNTRVLTGNQSGLQVSFEMILETDLDVQEGGGPVINFSYTDSVQTRQTIGNIGFVRGSGVDDGDFIVRCGLNNSRVERLKIDENGVTTLTGDLNLTAGKNLTLQASGATGFMDLGEITVPANPAANNVRVYGKLDGAVTKLFYKQEDGTEVGPLAAAGAAALPVVDTTSIAEGSVDATKEVRFEVDGNTTGIIGVLATIFTTAKTVTFPDATDTLMGKATTDVMTNKSYDLGGTGNVLTGSVAEFNTALQADTFAFISDNLSVFAATTSAQLAGVISDETGSGLLVFGTSPTLITPALGTPASGVMTNVTGTSGITGLGTQTQDLNLGSNQIVGLLETEELWIGAEAMVSTTTNGAAFASRELPTNDVMISTFAYDTTTSESAQFTWTPPLNWNAGTVRFKLYWTNAAGLATETIDFDLAAVAFADNDAIDAAFGTAQNVTDTFLAQNDMHITAFSAAITIAGSPVAGEAVIFKLSRDVVADNLTGDAEVIGILLEYTITELGTT